VIRQIQVAGLRIICRFHRGRTDETTGLHVWAPRRDSGNSFVGKARGVRSDPIVHRATHLAYQFTAWKVCTWPKTRSRKSWTFERSQP
jgi:hypothetical protein